MADGHLRQHALAHRGLAARPRVAGAGVHLWVEGPRVQLCLRGAGRAFRDAVAGVTGVEPPQQANTAASAGATALLWLGPDEWLAVAPPDATALAGELEAALEGRHSLVSDVSHSRVILGLAGAHATEVLMKGCSLDLESGGVRPGQCAQAPLARAHALLHRLDEAPTWHVYVHRSFADYAHAWLADAAAEYGVDPGPPAQGTG